MPTAGRTWIGILAIFTALIVASPPSFGAAALEGAEDGAIDIGNLLVGLHDPGRFDFSGPLGHRVARFSYQHSRSRFLRLAIKDLKLGPDDRLVIRGKNLFGNGAPLNGEEIVGPVDAAGAQHLSPLIAGDRVEVELSGPTLEDADLTIAEIYYEKPPAQPWLSIYGKNDLQKFADFEGDASLYAAGRAVVFLSYLDGKTVRVCSGFLLSPTAVVTNNHCVADQTSCSTTQVVFDYFADDHHRVSMGEQRTCASVAATDYALDYSVLLLDHPVDGRNPPLKLMTTDVAPLMPAYLIQHPGGQPKQVSVVGCDVLEEGVPGRDETRDTDLAHRCDTINGSSGSPFLVERDEADGTKVACVAALHHWGFLDNGKFATRNRAIRAMLITASLAEKGIAFEACPQD